MNIANTPVSFQEPEKKPGLVLGVVAWVLAFMGIRDQALAANSKGQSFHADTSELPAELQELVSAIRALPKATAALVAYAIEPKAMIGNDGIKHNNAWDHEPNDPYKRVVGLALGLALDLTVLPPGFVEGLPTDAQKPIARALWLGYHVKAEVDRRRYRAKAKSLGGGKPRDKDKAKAARKARRENRA